MEKRVAIIGSGICGLLACKHTLSKGFNPIVFEAQDNIGGVWYKTTENTRLQSVKEFYQFVDFPWPPHVQDKFPSSAQVREYLKSYAENFELLPYIKFNSEVVSMDYAGESAEERVLWNLWCGNNGKAFGSSKGKWTLRVRDTKQDPVEDYEYEAEFVILCIGRFSGLPDIPEYRLGHGPEVFSGKVLHSMDYYTTENTNASQLIKGKRIAIIGSGKSAIDIAFECANANGISNPCTVVQRTVHWMFPDVEAWGVSFGYLCFSRFAELMVHKPGEGLFSSVLATLLSPLRWGISKFVESYARWKLPLKKFDMIPEETFVREASSCQILFLLDNFYDKVEDGSIVFKKSNNIEFCKEGLILDGGNDIVKADIVIFATGYKGDHKLRQIFADPTFQRIIAGTENTSIPLYRYNQMISQNRYKNPKSCPHCQALLFSGETTQFCCRKGRTKLDPIPAPIELQSLFSLENEEGRHFRQYVRAYNHVFSFTSMGVHVDERLASGTAGIYTFRSQGSIYHSIGSLLPSDTNRPRYMQMWIVDRNS